MTDFPDTEYTAGTRPDEATAPDYRPGTLVFGDWVVAEQLGAGAFGAVYRLQKHSYGFTTESAMKVIRIPQSQADVRSILSEGMDQGSATDYFRGVVDEIVQEIAVMAQLKSHPAIVSYEDHQILPHEGSIGWDILIRMELLTSLIDYQQKHPLQREDILALGTRSAVQLAFCETRHLIHRDIKPENIFVNDTGFFKLGDFGVARTVERTSGSLSKKGTESYMAPEVYLGKPYGPSVDLYSLGLVLYRLCNHNRLPFFPAYPAPITFRAREDALSHRMRGDALPPPDQADPALSAVILKACAYHPEDRLSYRQRTENSSSAVGKGTRGTAAERNRKSGRQRNNVIWPGCSGRTTIGPIVLQQPPAPIFSGRSTPLF